MKEMNALKIADDLAEFLANHRGQMARVHSVFPHAANLVINEDELITLTNQDEITPMGLMVDSSESFTKLLQPGDEMILNIDRIRSIKGNNFINLQDAQAWASGLMTNQVLRSADEVAQVALQLTEWLAGQPALGLLPLLPRLTNQALGSNPADDNLYSRFIADDLEAFTEAVARCDWELALNLADRLVGFGMGSTPSCDDFLAAYLLVFSLTEQAQPGFYPWVREFNKAIAEKAKKRTTLISATMLRHAANGKVSSSHQQLIQICLFNGNSELEQSANQVLHYGATSGGDFLLGLVCALTWYRNSMVYIPKEGEDAWVEFKQSQPVPII